MVDYAFETITDFQALTIKAGDTLRFNGPAARTVSVAYQSYEPATATLALPGIAVTYQGRSITFSTELVALSKTGGLVMADGSQLYIGDLNADRFASGAGDDGLYGGPGGDSLNGGAGADLLQGNAGNDVLTGGEGGDSLYGGQGDDVIYASRAATGVAGEAGDWAHGNLGDDEIVGGAGSDTLLGGQGRDSITGGDGSDYLSGDLGDDRLTGGLGNDTLVAGEGDDRLDGGFGADSLSGGGGNDQLVSQGPEASVLDGGAGDDTLVSVGAGRDTLFGGDGADRFEFVGKIEPSVGIEAEIRDWSSADTLHFDAVTVLSGAATLPPPSYAEFVSSSYEKAVLTANEYISATGATYVAAEVAGDVYVFADTGDPQDGADIAILLTGRTLADISLANFV